MRTASPVPWDKRSSTYLSARNVAWLRLSDHSSQGLDVEFIARPAKVESLMPVIALIAPDALIEVQDTTIIRGQPARNREAKLSRRTA